MTAGGSSSPAKPKAPGVSVAGPSVTGPSVTFPTNHVALDQQFKDMLAGEFVPEAFGDWCVVAGLTGIRRFGARVTEEKEVKVEIIDACNGYPGFLNTIVSPGDISGVKLVWGACRRILDKGAPSDSLLEVSEPMGTTTFTSLKTLWVDHHHFVFNSKHMVNTVILNKMYKHATAKPKVFFVLLPEEIKLASTVGSLDKEEMKLKKNHDGTASFAAAQNDVDPVYSHHVFFKRVIAMFNSWAYVSIADPTWLSYQKVRDFYDTLEDLIFRRVRGERPPLEFVLRAYLKMMGVFFDQINTHSKTLNDCLEDEHKWENIWTSWSPAPSQNAGEQNQASGGTPTIAQLDPGVERRMLQVHRMAKAMLKNGQKKGAKGAHNTYYQDDHDGGKGTWYQKEKGGGKKKGKGKGKGKGQGKGVKGKKKKSEWKDQGGWKSKQWGDNTWKAIGER